MAKIALDTRGACSDIKAQADSLLRRAFYIMSTEVDEVISTIYRSSYVELRLKA
jgi:hypothetical protein